MSFFDDIKDTAVTIGSLGTINPGAEDAANAQLAANREGLEAQRYMFDRSVQLNEPFREIGLQGLRDYQGSVNAYSPESRLDQIRNAFANSNEQQNLLKTGFDQVQGSAAAQGSLFSGNTLKGLEDYRLGTFNNFANQYNNLADQKLNRLAALGNVGQTATNTQIGLNNQFGQNQAQFYQNQGDIRAAREMAPVNSFLNFVNTGANAYGAFMGGGKRASG